MSACGRCGGLLTRDEEFSLSIDRKMPSLRCIQCGEWLDEIILRNRVVSGDTEPATDRPDVIPPMIAYG
jgi:hypothetical protein